MKNSFFKSQSSRLLPTILFTLLALTSCDRGYEMRPVRYDGPGSTEIWTYKFDGFELQANPLHGLVGEGFIGPELSISTHDKPVTIDKIELITRTGVYDATFYDTTRVIPPFANAQNLNATFWLTDPNGPPRKYIGAAKLLDESNQVVLTGTVDKKAFRIPIDYRRAR